MEEILKKLYNGDLGAQETEYAVCNDIAFAEQKIELIEQKIKALLPPGSDSLLEALFTAIYCRDEIEMQHKFALGFHYGFSLCNAGNCGPAPRRGRRCAMRPRAIHPDHVRLTDWRGAPHGIVIQ